jgi:hypothetical protein
LRKSSNGWAQATFSECRIPRFSALNVARMSAHFSMHRPTPLELHPLRRRHPADAASRTSAFDCVSCVEKPDRTSLTSSGLVIQKTVEQD